jgi:dolichyl-phosphate-mannose--protein O-mannosyl transferase
MHAGVASQKVAIETNNKLTKDHVFASRPEAWPILKRGISYWQVCISPTMAPLLVQYVLVWIGLDWFGLVFI